MQKFSLIAVIPVWVDFPADVSMVFGSIGITVQWNMLLSHECKDLGDQLCSCLSLRNYFT